MELPAEPMMEILARLPVRSLLRFKSVCRSWRSLIEDPYFIAQHLKRSSLDGSSSRFLLARYYSDSESKYFTSLLSCETLEVLRRIDVPYRDHLGYVNIIASSDGIVCLSSGLGISLFNPSTREFRVLSNSLSSSTDSSLWGGRVYYGFGYNRGIGDHKLISILASCRQGNEPLYRAHVITLKDRLWREVPASNCDIIYKFEGTVANGVVHWIAHGGRQRGSEVILSFDLGDDTFGELSLPDVGEDDENYKRLYVFDEMLGLMVYSDSRRVSCINVWLRNSAASPEEWTRVATIDPALGVCRPVGVGARGEILIENNYGRLAAYEATTRVARDVKVDAEKNPVYFDFHPYVESLLPVNRSR